MSQIQPDFRKKTVTPGRRFLSMIWLNLRPTVMHMKYVALMAQVTTGFYFHALRVSLSHGFQFQTELY